MNLCAMPLTVVSLIAGLSPSADVTTTTASDEDCPIILLERSGGLGSEAKSGVIAAVWASGKIIRAESLDRPWSNHVQGQLAPEPLAELLDFVSSESAWNEPVGEVALDTGDDTVTLRRRDKHRSWAETPGVTSTRLVGQLREKLGAVRIERPTRIREPFESLRTCTK